jgi:diguanylate cyclase (GGDEF)-like protein
VALPLVQRNLVIGVVCLESRRQPYSEAEVRLAQSLVQPAAMAVENARLFDEVQRYATLDGLTGTFNRRHFMERAQQAYDNSRRFGHALTAMMLDVDHFKRVNDRHGHHVGDQVLRALAERCRSALRSVDLLGRYGGEEFAILLPGASEQSAATVLAERIRRKVAEEPIETDDGPVRVTISIGVATIDQQMRSPEDLFKRADAALYEAKQAGRNRVVEDAVA